MFLRALPSVLHTRLAHGHAFVLARVLPTILENNVPIMLSTTSRIMQYMIIVVTPCAS